MNEPHHERLRRDLESAASEAREGAGGRRLVTGKHPLIGLLAAVPFLAMPFGVGIAAPARSGFHEFLAGVPPHAVVPGDIPRPPYGSARP